MLCKITSLENGLYQVDNNDVPLELTGMIEFAKMMLPDPKDFDAFMEKLETKKQASLELKADTGLVVDMFEVDYPEGGQGNEDAVLQNLDRKKDLVSETVLPDTTVPDVNIVAKPPIQSAIDMDKYTSDGRPIHPKTICRKCGDTTRCKCSSRINCYNPIEYVDECFSCRQKSGKKLAMQDDKGDTIYTKLAPSPLGGLGIFAIKDIKKGTPVFLFYDDSDEKVLTPEEIAKLSPKDKELYHNHAVVMPNGNWVVPADYNRLHTVWYLNHSSNPNVAPDDNFNWYVTRDIKEGEELTGNYENWDAEGTKGFDVKSHRKNWRQVLRALADTAAPAAPTKAPERSPVIIPEKMPPVKPSRPSPFRKPNIEPGKEPQPKALPVNYPKDSKARMHPKLQKMIDTKDTPYHALPQVPGGEFLSDIASTRFRMIVKLIEKYSGVKVRTINDMASALMRVLQRVKDIERTYTPQLEELAVILVEQYFGIKKGEMEFDAKLQRSVDISGIRNLDAEQAKEVGEKLPSFDIDLEVSKRRFINGLIQGAGINSLYMFHLIGEELNAIDPDLVNMYGLLSALTEFGYWVTSPTMSGLELSDAPAGGQVKLDFSKEEPVVVAVALTFPMLVHELVKGVMELMSSHGLPEDEKTREQVLNRADNFQDETWDIRFGPEIWKRLVNALSTENLNNRALSMLYDEVVQLDAATFSDFVQGILSGNPEAVQKWNVLYNNAVNETENSHTSSLNMEEAYDRYKYEELANDRTPQLYRYWLAAKEKGNGKRE